MTAGTRHAQQTPGTMLAWFGVLSATADAGPADGTRSVPATFQTPIAHPAPKVTDLPVETGARAKEEKTEEKRGRRTGQNYLWLCAVVRSCEQGALLRKFRVGRGSTLLQYTGRELGGARQLAVAAARAPPTQFPVQRQRRPRVGNARPLRPLPPGRVFSLRLFTRVASPRSDRSSPTKARRASAPYPGLLRHSRLAIRQSQQCVGRDQIRVPLEPMGVAVDPRTVFSLAPDKFPGQFRRQSCFMPLASSISSTPRASKALAKV